jgi:uncharacterized damage-inducible protein DinB
MKNHLLLAFLLCLSGGLQLASAQTEKEMIAAEWERAKAYTLEYLEAMTEEGYNWKPTPDVRTFAGQMLHLTDANFGLAAAAFGKESPVARGENENAEDQSKENVIKLVTAGYDYVIEGIKAMDEAALDEKIKLFGQFEATRRTALQKTFEHQTHHRGQTTLYLRLAGVKPPQEKLF